jgi:hypothetical protein
VAQYLMQMARVPSSNLARDRVVTTFHLDTDVPPVDLFDGGPNDLARDAAEAFVEAMPHVAGFTGWECRAYRHGGAKGDPPEARALCLSYYADQNIPRRRGRMYLGPWPASQMAERPGDVPTGELGLLATRLSGLGGINVQWVQYSPSTGEFHNVTNFWIDDEWDTIRSRGLRATKRALGAANG